MAGIGKGLIRTIRSNSQFIVDLIPVDIVANLMIAAAWDKAIENKYIKKKMKDYSLLHFLSIYS